MPQSLNKKLLLNLTQTLTPQSVILIQKIAELKGRQNIYANQQPEYLNKLQLNAFIENTINSNYIDGLTINYKRFIELFEELYNPESENESELLRYIKVVNLINSRYETIELQPELILQFHRNIFRYKPDQGGLWKSSNRAITRKNSDGTERIVFVPVDKDRVEQFMSHLCNNYNELINDPDVVDLVVIAAFILDFLCIHPFDAGNGRVSRLLTMLLLYKSDYQVAKYYPIDSILRDNKVKYFQTLNQTSQGWHEGQHNLPLWIEFFLLTLYQAYFKLDKQMYKIKSKRGAKTQQVKQVIDGLSEMFKVADIVDKCPGISRPTINKVLQQLRDEKLIAPNSLGRDALWEKHY